MTGHEPGFDLAAIDAYVAGLEDAAFAPLLDRCDECRDCGGSGYATTRDGRDLGACSTCQGHGGAA